MTGNKPQAFHLNRQKQKQKNNLFLIPSVYIPRQLGLFLFFLSLHSFFNQLAAWPVSPQDDVYTFLHRASIQGKLSTYSYQLPWDNREILMALSEIERNQPSHTEKKQIQFYRKLYTTHTPTPYTSWSSPDSQKVIQLKPQLTSDFQRSPADIYTLNKAALYASLGLKGQWSENLDYLTQVFIAQEWSSQDVYFENYNPRRGQPYNTPQKASNDKSSFNLNSFDGSTGAFTFKWSWGRLELTRDWNQWGPGLWQHTALSDKGYIWVNQPLNQGSSLTDAHPSQIPEPAHRSGFSSMGQAAPLTQLRLVWFLPFARYVQWTGLRMGLDQNINSCVAAHRIEIGKGWIQAGFHEVVSYTRTVLDIQYLPPLLPYWISEHFGGDRDNVTLGFDLSIRPGYGLRMWTELFLDDLVSPFSLFENYWGNKYASTLGLEWHPKWPFYMQLEYSRVEPWLFTHHLPLGAPNNQYQHFGSLLGSSLPSGSHRITYQMGWQGFSHVSPFLKTSYRAWGWQERGAQILDIHKPGDPTTKIFLGSLPEEYWETSVGLQIHPASFLRADIQMGWEYLKNSPYTSGVQKGLKIQGSWSLWY